MNPRFTIPRFALPGFVARIGARLPQWPHAITLTTGLNALLKMGLLPEDSLAALEDKIFRVTINDTGGTATFGYSRGLFRPLFRAERSPDLSFAANLSAYLQLLARQEDPDTLFFNRELSIEGDTELGLVVKNMLDAVEFPKLNLPLPFPNPRH